MKRTFRQLLLLFVIFALHGCFIKKDENPPEPPPTFPLSRDYIGFGVITASFTHVTSEPSGDSASMGYLRRGSIVRVLRRQLVKSGAAFVPWVLTEPPGDGFADGNQHVIGWLREDVMEIYDSENKAKTAANQRFE